LHFCYVKYATNYNSVSEMKQKLTDFTGTRFFEQAWQDCMVHVRKMQILKIDYKQNNQSKRDYIAPHVATESELHVGLD